MASKFAKLRETLPAFEQESTFQQKVEEFKSNIAANPEWANVSWLAKSFAEAKRSKDHFEEQISSLNVTLEGFSQMLVERMQVDDMEKIGLSDGSTCYISYEVYPSVKDKEALLAWVKKAKLAGSLALPWQTLRGLCNELSVNGKPLPKGVECYIKTQARVRKNGSE